MELTALVDHPDHVCCRYRVAAFQGGLAGMGHSVTMHALPKRWWSRLLLYRKLAGKTVLVQRRLLPAWELFLLRRTVRHLLFDLDDAVFLRDSYSPKGTHHPRKLASFARTSRLADAVVAGNGFLADAARKFTDTDRVHVIPTCVDPRLYPVREKSPTDGKTLVWIGSSSTLQGLEAVRPLLERLGRAVPGLRLKVICDRFPTFANLEVVRVPWSAATESAELSSSDVGISWIPDDLWSRGKCGLKVLQYMASSLPVVANPVGVHPEMIRPGVTGYLPREPEEWVAAVRTLVGEAGLGRRMGDAGRRVFEASYSVEAGVRAWAGLLDRLSQPRWRKRA